MRTLIALMLPIVFVVGCASTSGQYATEQRTGAGPSGSVDVLGLATMSEIDRAHFCHGHWQELGCSR